jgi:hypothetical protein
MTKLYKIQNVFQFKQAKNLRLDPSINDDMSCMDPLIIKSLKKGEEVLCTGQFSSSGPSYTILYAIPATCLLSILLIISIPIRGIDFSSISMTALGVILPITILIAYFKQNRNPRIAVFAFTNKRVIILSGYPWRFLNVYEPTKRRYWRTHNSFSKILYDKNKNTITLLLNRTAYQRYIPNPTIYSSISTQEILSIVKHKYEINIKSKFLKRKIINTYK